MTTGWAPDMGGLEAEWTALVTPPARPVDLSAWATRLLGLTDPPSWLESAQLWAVSPEDLLHSAGWNRWPSAHAVTLAWLCSPDAGHGLGDSLLRSLINLTGDPVSVAGPVTITVEETRDVVDPRDASGGTRATRADVVMRGGDWTLVMKLHIDASHDPLNASRIRLGWRNEPGLRLLWISRAGVLPCPAFDDGQSEWAGASWTDLRADLERLAARADEGPGRPALLDYLRTLRATFQTTR